MKNILYILLAICLTTACDKNEQGGSSYGDSRPVEVVLSTTQSSSGQDSRTELQLSGEVRWSVGDKIRVWAKSATNANAGYTLNGQDFTFATYNATYNSADFKATLADSMANGSYNYDAIYPLPTTGSQNDTRVTYTLPSVQSGLYDPKLDVMYASADGNALNPIDATPDRVEWADMPQPKLEFKHLFHLVRIHVPENKLGDPIKQLDIFFPYSVVGDVDFDATYPNNPASPMNYTNLSNKITVILPDENLLDANGRYVWLHVFPSQGAVSSGNLRLRALSKSGIISQEVVSTALNNKTFQGGHITPIALTIPESDESAYKEITFSCPDNSSYPNFLGENATTMYVDAWPANLKPIKSQSSTISSSGSGQFKVKFYYLNDGDYQFNTNVSDAKMTVSFDSANTSVKHNKFTTDLPDFATSSNAYYALPYLFFEDFANASDFSSNDVHVTTGGTGNKDYVSITGLSGWNGGRVGVKAGNSLRIAPRYESVIGGATYGARVDSKPLTSLTTQSNIAVYYKYGMNAQIGGINASLKTMYCRIGYVSADATISNSGDDEGQTIISYEMKEQTADWNNIPYYKSETYENVPAEKSRLMWRAYTENTWGASNCVCWLYIDDVKVSIGGSVKHSTLDYRSYFPNHTN